MRLATVNDLPDIVVLGRQLHQESTFSTMDFDNEIVKETLTDLMNRVRQPFNVNSLAQAAAIAALQDTEFLAKSFTVNREGKAQLQEGFAKLGLTFIPSFANFVLVKVGDAARVNLELLKRGVIVRPVAGDGLPEWLRVSIGLPHENQTFLNALTAIVQADAT